MEALIEKPTKADQKIARQSFAGLKKVTGLRKARHGEGVNIVFRNSDTQVIVPERALFLLEEILENMAAGKTITLIPSDSELSTQQAAEMLQVSRPHLVKLLEEGEIPFKKVGSHRRIRLDDLTAYSTRLKKTRSEKLAFLAKQAQELNLGY